jgi:hypothetical protein
MWFKKLNNLLMRTYSNSGRTYGALAMGIDAAGKYIVIGATTDLVLDSNIQNGKASAYGKGSIAMSPDGGFFTVDADGFWQSATLTAASPSASPSHSASPSTSVSPSASGSPSVSPSHSASPSVSPSGSASASVSPSGSASPSHSASASVSPSGSASPSV